MIMRKREDIEGKKQRETFGEEVARQRSKEMQRKTKRERDIVKGKGKKGKIGARQANREGKREKEESTLTEQVD